MSGWEAGNAWRPWKFSEPWRLKHYVQKEDLDGDALARALPPMSDPFEVAGLLYARMAELGLDYVDSLRTADGTEQRIRQPYRVIASKRAGSCLDLSLVYAALCMTAGLLPMVAVVDRGRGRGRHALVLVPNEQVKARRPRTVDLRRFAPDDVWYPDAEELRAEIDAGTWVAVETTSMTRDRGPCDFEAACGEGRKAFDGPCEIQVVNVGSPARGLPVFAVDMPLANRRPRPEVPVERITFAERAQEEIRRRFPDTVLPPVLDVPSLERERRTAREHDADVLLALIVALNAKQTFETIGGGRPRLEELHVLFFEATSGRVGAESADGLLVEAALGRGAGSLSRLARFILNVAHCNGVGMENPMLLAWLDRHGAQREDAAKHLADRPDKHLAIIRIGGRETVRAGPSDGNGRSEDESVEISMEVRPAIEAGKITSAHCSPDGIPAALQRLVEDLSRRMDGRQVLIDLVAPRRYLDKRYERLGRAVWRIRHKPRLRWSEHDEDGPHRQAHRERHGLADWREPPALVPDAAALDGRSLDEWLWDDEVTRRPCLIAGHRDGEPGDLLETLLREGCGHIVWFSDRGHRTAEDDTRVVWDGLHSPNRRLFFPDQLMSRVASASIIWNEPERWPGVRTSGSGARKAGRKLPGTPKRKTG